jgi:hypothetical protein
MKAKQSEKLATVLGNPKSREELRKVLSVRDTRKSRKIEIDGKSYRVVLGDRRSVA